jgi:hypothetical protein
VFQRHAADGVYVVESTLTLFRTSAGMLVRPCRDFAMSALPPSVAIVSAVRKEPGDGPEQTRKLKRGRSGPASAGESRDLSVHGKLS